VNLPKIIRPLSWFQVLLYVFIGVMHLVNAHLTDGSRAYQIGLVVLGLLWFGIAGMEVALFQLRSRVEASREALHAKECELAYARGELAAAKKFQETYLGDHSHD
jgi:hypothetical protein